MSKQYDTTNQLTQLILQTGKLRPRKGELPTIRQVVSGIKTSFLISGSLRQFTFSVFHTKHKDVGIYFYYNKIQGCINNLKLKVNPFILHMEIVVKGIWGSGPVPKIWNPAWPM